MPTTFDALSNHFSTSLTSAHNSGDGILYVASTTGFSTPCRVVASMGFSAESETIIAILMVTSVGTGQLLISGAVEGTTDVALPVGTKISVRGTAGHYSDVTGAIVALQEGGGGGGGSQGPQGYQGAVGVQGSQGRQGVQGSQGSQGSQGFQGQAGTGSQGFQGAVGPQGYQGATGVTGSQGSQGFQGGNGTQGYQGANGTIGAQGANGTNGANGTQGNQGSTGPQGNQGTYSTSVANTFTAQQNFGPSTTLTDGSSIAWNVANAQCAKVTLGGNRTLANPSNLVDCGTYILRVLQDGTGSRTLAYGTAFKWAGGTAPTLSTAASAIDIITFVSDGTNLYGSCLKGFA